MPFKSEKQRKWMWANDPEMAKKWEKEESVEKLKEIVREELKFITEGWDKYHLGGLLDSKVKKRLERTIRIIGGKVDAVGDDYIKFRIGKMDLVRLPGVIIKLDHNKSVWIGDKRKKNIWDRRRNINKLNEYPNKKESTMGSSSISVYKTPKAYSKSTQSAMDIDIEDDEILNGQSKESIAAPFRRRKFRGLGRPIRVGLDESGPNTSITWSNPESRIQVSDDIKKMSKILGKASQGVIKIMMQGVKSGRYDALDLSRGIEYGDVRNTHEGEREFIKVLWHKVRKGFRRYSKRGKLRNY